MANMTLSVPDELHARMKKYCDVKWSAVAREEFERRLEVLDALERVAEKSTLTPEDVRELGATMKKAAAKRLIDEARRRYKHFDGRYSSR